MNSKLKLSHTKFHLSIIVVLSLAASFATCYFATPSVFGGRDQGAIATAAIDLAEYKSFTFSTPVSRDLFQKYGAGKALNYPGFDYTKDGQLTSRFPKAYIAYLAIGYKFFGLKGLQYANLLPLFLFLFLFWLTLRYFFSEKISFLGFLVAATFFPFLWFAKYTLTEIFMLFLVWAGIYFLTSYRRGLISTKAIYFSLTFFAFSALARIEGIIFFLLAAGYAYALDRKKIVALPKNFKKYALVFSLLLIIACAYFNFPTLLDSLKNFATFLPNSTKDSAPSANLYSHLARVFFSYNIVLYLIFGLTGIFWLFKNTKKNWPRLEYIPLLITFPAFFYLLSPQISLDDPWLLRRFVFAVFPVLIFYSIYLLDRFFYHKIFLHIILVALILGNFVISWRFLPVSENKGLLPQIEKISQKFGPEDLVLVDRMATGSGFSLMSEPMASLFGKNAVYFFNADDLKLIDRAKYKNIYLAVPAEDGKKWYTGVEKLPAGFSVITNNFLEPSEKKWGLAINTEFEGAIIFWKVK